MRQNIDQEIVNSVSELAALPVATEEDLDALATIAMSNLYYYCGVRGGRVLNGSYHWLISSVDGHLTGYTVPVHLRPAFQSVCETKWRNLMRYLY